MLEVKRKMSPVCPKCGNAHLSQLDNARFMVCGSGHYFRLEEVKFGTCPNCGKYKHMLPNGLCEECAKKLAEVMVDV